MIRIFKHPLFEFNQRIPECSKLLDVGALNFSEYKRIKDIHPNVEHFGVDYCAPTENVPDNYNFRICDLNKEMLPFENDFFDIVVASHVIEHLDDPLVFFKEAIRVLKPNGKLYLEAPSERSLFIKGNNTQLENMYCLNYYDDPTHNRRPWTKQSFYRLAKYFGCDTIEIEYVESILAKFLYPLVKPYALLTGNGRLLEKITWYAKGWCVYMICTKKFYGTPEFKYFINRD